MFKQRITGDCVEIMPKLERKFDLILTDPIYNVGWKYNNKVKDNRKDYIEWCYSWVDICIGLLKENGILAIINYPEHNNRIFTYLYDKLNPIQQIVWNYNTNFGFSSRKYTRSHRTIILFSKGNDYTFNPIKQPYKNLNDKRIQKLISEGSKGTNHYDVININLCKNISKEKKNIGINQLPNKLVDFLIESFTNEGDWILDPFVGNGTVIDRADVLGRNSVGIDIVDYDVSY